MCSPWRRCSSGLHSVAHARTPSIYASPLHLLPAQRSGHGVRVCWDSNCGHFRSSALPQYFLLPTSRTGHGEAMHGEHVQGRRNTRTACDRKWPALRPRPDPYLPSQGECYCADDDGQHELSVPHPPHAQALLGKGFGEIKTFASGRPSKSKRAAQPTSMKMRSSILVNGEA